GTERQDLRDLAAREGLGSLRTRRDGGSVTMFRRRSVPSESTEAAPKFTSSRRQRDAVKARTGATTPVEIAVVVPCLRCGAAMRTILLAGHVPGGIREGAGHLADVEVLESLCPDCKETS